MPQNHLDQVAADICHADSTIFSATSQALQDPTRSSTRRSSHSVRALPSSSGYVTFSWDALSPCLLVVGCHRTLILTTIASLFLQYTLSYAASHSSPHSPPSHSHIPRLSITIPPSVYHDAFPFTCLSFLPLPFRTTIIPGPRRVRLHARGPLSFVEDRASYRRLVYSCTAHMLHAVFAVWGRTFTQYTYIISSRL
ncbi:hypothetical protein BD626DRAFT_503859 [Schizophyllum amplum]|uniref:Uncharacterized protein n=1 Tax=Schizophyllum amplum TaxID=97359 RepID=A0A550C7K1_9AGAR|nr:hypothetical protein BD626DRAFT_503859 [Auriculariopsis ampla]